MNKKSILCALLLVPTIIFGMKKQRMLSLYEQFQVTSLAKEYRKRIRSFRTEVKDPDMRAAKTFEPYELELLIQARDLTEHQRWVIQQLLTGAVHD
jgi:hypothetical protein